MISPVENNGMVLRTQDFTAIRHNEENRANNQHVQIQDTLDQNEDVSAHTVREKDNSDGADTRHDAREEGRNKYVNLRKKNDKKDPLGEGVVVAKKRASFDMSV